MRHIRFNDMLTSCDAAKLHILTNLKKDIDHAMRNKCFDHASVLTTEFEKLQKQCWDDACKGGRS